MRSVILVVALAMGAAACVSGSGATPPSGTAETTGPASDPAAAAAILGTWRRVNTCEELVHAFTAVGIANAIPQGIVGMNFRDDPVRVIAHDADPCTGAKSVMRTDIFRDNGYLTNYQGAQITDECRCYTLVGGGTFVVLGDPGDPDISLHYTISGNMLRFKAQIPHPSQRGRVATNSLSRSRCTA